MALRRRPQLPPIEIRTLYPPIGYTDVQIRQALMVAHAYESRLFVLTASPDHA